MDDEPWVKIENRSKFASPVVQRFSNVYNVQHLLTNIVEVLMSRRGSVHLSERFSSLTFFIHFLFFFFIMSVQSHKSHLFSSFFSRERLKFLMYMQRQIISIHIILAIQFINLSKFAISYKTFFRCILHENWTLVSYTDVEAHLIYFNYSSIRVILRKRWEVGNYHMVAYYLHSVIRCSFRKNTLQ